MTNIEVFAINDNATPAALLYAGTERVVNALSVTDLLVDSIADQAPSVHAIKAALEEALELLAAANEKLEAAA